jgi:hypothetical protein
MFKDPYHEATTPYELLGLDPGTSSGALHGALSRFMRDPRNASRIRLAQDALKRLKSALGRAAVDIWFYDFDPTHYAGAEGDDGGWLDSFSGVHALSPAELCTDLDAADLSLDVRQVIPSRMKLTDLSYYDGLETLSVRPSVDVD